MCVLREINLSFKKMSPWENKQKNALECKFYDKISSTFLWYPVPSTMPDILQVFNKYFFQMNVLI